jgi:uncharacterized protein (UPF0335 family)
VSDEEARLIRAIAHIEAAEAERARIVELVEDAYADDTGMPYDRAYNQAIDDILTAIREADNVA